MEIISRGQFSTLSNQPTITDVQNAMPTLERFTVLLYSRTSNVLTTNECPREVFCHGRSIDNIPPTGAALLKLVLRSAYIAGYVLGQFMIAHQRLPSPEVWGWKYESSNYIPIWTDLPEASIAIRDLIKCKCNPELGCKQLCECNIAHLSCTELCRCKGDCERD